MTARTVMSRFLRRVAVAALVAAPFATALCSTAIAQQVFTPLTTFGSNGWLAPGAIPFLDTSNSQRGLGVNPLSGNLVLPDRDADLGNNAYVLNGTTGAVSGTLAPPAGGYSGGTFVVNMAGVGADGAVYVANLVTSTATQPFKVYRWASDADFTTPATVAFNNSASVVNRIGDSFAVFGSGSATIWAAAGSNSAAGTNSAFTIGTTDGSNTQTTYSAVPNTTTASNGYRLGLSFINSSSLLGTQGGNKLYTTTFSPSVSNIETTGTTNWGAAMRPIAYLEHSGTSWVATIDTNSSTVSLFNLTDPAVPVLSGTGNATVGTLSANLNGAGGIGWGPYLGNDQYLLYAMSSNQGIQAFTVDLAAVPEPSTWAMLAAAAGVGGLAGLRRRLGSRRKRGSETRA